MTRSKSILAELPQAENLDFKEILESFKSGGFDLLCVLGPTASGKTKYAVRLAREAGGEIISADSRQVYRGMDIGTGKDLDEYSGIPYHLIDIRPAGDRYNVYEFSKDFFEAYSDIRGRGFVPILCGGTGLYISAVTSDYDFQSRMPLSQPRDNITGQTLKTYFIGILVDRQTRNGRIDARLDVRLKEGMVDEIRGLLDSGVPAGTLISYGLEYKFVTQYLLGELSYAEMREKLAIAIHQFAKRQMTWFRGMERSGAVIHWVDPAAGAE